MTLMTHIKTCVEEVDNRSEAFTKALELLHKIGEEKINLDEMCHCQGLPLYRHNLYLVDAFYLFLGECYDFALDDDTGTVDYILAKKYYTVSNQPAAKWRLGKMYLDKKLRYDGNVQVIAGRLIVEAINGLINELGDPHYFGKKLDYLGDMYQDIYPMGYPKTYYEILRWIIEHQNHLQAEHSSFVTRLCEFDVPPQSEADQEILDQIYSFAI